MTGEKIVKGYEYSGNAKNYTTAEKHKEDNGEKRTKKTQRCDKINPAYYHIISNGLNLLEKDLGVKYEKSDEFRQEECARMENCVINFLRLNS